MKIKLGIAPIAWSNDDMPELGGDTPIEKCLEDASTSGFSGIELGGKFPRNPGNIHDEQEFADLGIISKKLSPDIAFKRQAIFCLKM